MILFPLWQLVPLCISLHFPETYSFYDTFYPPLDINVPYKVVELASFRTVHERNNKLLGKSGISNIEQNYFKEKEQRALGT